MPATYTHHLFTKDVYKALDINIQKKLDSNLFDLFGKSFDALRKNYRERRELSSLTLQNVPIEYKETLKGLGFSLSGD